jgi:prepilin-type N-terminal cleavage/methylation domain-containing protein
VRSGTIPAWLASSRAAFTLIELLVVIAILGADSGLMTATSTRATVWQERRAIQEEVGGKDPGRGDNPDRKPSRKMAVLSCWIHCVVHARLVKFVRRTQ